MGMDRMISVFRDCIAFPVNGDLTGSSSGGAVDVGMYGAARTAGPMIAIDHITLAKSHGMLMRLPTGFTSVATTGVRSDARPAQRMGDMCRQVSWLTAQAFPPAFPTRASMEAGVSGVRGENLPLTVAGAAPGLHEHSCAPDSHFHQGGLHRPGTVTPTMWSDRQRGVKRGKCDCCGDAIAHVCVASGSEAP